jgi:rhamnose transport system substrate-binding protein
VASTTVPGVAQAIEQAGMTGEIKVIGYGSPNTVRPYIESGVMEASILWDPKALGYLTFWAGVQLVNGEEFEEENEVVGMEDAIRFFEEDGILLLGEPLVITAENIDDFDF